MTYSEFLEKLTPFAETDFADFQRKLIFTDRKVMGIRTPVLRKLAKALKGEIKSLFTFPDEYYETVFIKLTVVSSLPYEEMLSHLDQCVALIDNWGLCDSFKITSVKKNKEAFLPVLQGIFEKGGEYDQRFVLVQLLFGYVEEKYLPTIEDYIQRSDTRFYYVHMAVAWLTAEILIKAYPFGVTLLQKGILDTKTHNKAIQKAIESYRLDKEQKEYLRSLKIKTNQ